MVSDNTNACKKCGHIFKKSGAKQIDTKQKEQIEQIEQIEDDLDWFLQELANEIKTRIEV